MKNRKGFLQSQQNIAAAAAALLFLLACLLFLLQSPRPGMLDTGLYDLILPKLGLERGSFYAQEVYYTQPNELFTVSQIPWDGLLQVTPTSSLVYPAALTGVLCSMTGHAFSTAALAVVLAVLCSAALFVLVKALYALFGGWGVLAGSLWGCAVLCGNYLLYFNSLYSPAMFLLALTAFAAAVFRAWALLRLPEHGGVFVWLPAALCGLLLITASELSAVLLLPVAGLTLVIGLRASKGSRRCRAAAVLAAGLLLLCGVRFAESNGEIFNRTNLYHSFFDGVLTVSDAPEKTLSAFGLDPSLVQDIGKSAYLSEDAYYISPNGARADEIYDHISYPGILSYYLRHPVLLQRLFCEVLPQAGHVDTSHCVTVSSDAEPILRADYWDLVRGFFLTGPAGFVAVSLCCVLLGIVCLLRRRFGIGSALLLVSGSSWLLLAAALIGCGTADIAANRIFFQALLDPQLCILITFLAMGVQRAALCIAYSALSARRAPEPVFRAECYEPLASADSPRIAACRRAAHHLLADSRRFALAASAVCLLVMGLVLYVPRIGAYNNGDFGRMMDAMGLVYTPEDYFNPAVQYEKVIERYDYLEPYDWTRIRPGKMELTQSWISAGMRILYELADVPFSTAVLAAFHLLVLACCFHELILAVHRHLGKKPALLAAVLYIFLFCGSYNMGWLNSLFGEGIAFVGLMLVLASSVHTIEQSGKQGGAAGRRHGLLLLAFSCVYLACAKAQYAVLVPILFIWWVILAFVTAAGRKGKLLSLLAGGVVAAFLVSSAVGVYANNESVSSQDTLYSGLMNGILLYADDPEEALQELGLDPGLAADKGKHPYLPKDEYYCPPRTEKAEELLYSKVSSTDYLLWYLRHPKAFWQLLNDTAAASAEDMPNFNLYIGENNTQPHRTVNKFNIWARVRPWFVPRSFAVYVLLFGAICIAAFAAIVRRRSSGRRRLYAGLLIVFIALGAMQYPLPMVGNGHSDPVKQLYLFREVYDFVFLLLVVWASRLPGRVFSLRPPSDRVAENVRFQGLARPRCLRASYASLAPLGPRMERERPRNGQLRQDPSLAGVCTVRVFRRKRKLRKQTSSHKKGQHNADT